MSYGFPAFHEEEMEIHLDSEEKIDQIFKVAESLGWLFLGEATEGPLCFMVPFSWRSWAEFVEIEVKNNALKIRSECLKKTQIFDWGKNRSNCARFLTELKDRIGATPSVDTTAASAPG